MRQTDFTIGKVRHRLSRRRKRFRWALLMNLDYRSVYVLLKRCRQSKRDLAKISLRKRLIRSTTFNINVFSDEQSLKDFRFRPHEISKVAELIGFVNERTERSGYYCDAITAACIVLRRLAAPCRWHDLEIVFGLRCYVLSQVFWEALEGFLRDWAHILETFRSDLMEERAGLYAQAITDNGASLDCCVGFVDSTKIQMSRPGGPSANQRSCYSGHKRFHCLMYQTITTPDGIIFHMFGPEVGRRHDITLYRQSNLDAVLSSTMNINGRQFYLYGDPAYILRPWLQVGFSRTFATPAQLIHNAAMSAAREAVEWSYKDLKQMWSSQDYKRMLKVRKAPISLMYKGAALLWNIKVCMQHGGEAQSYFSCKPPCLSRYLNINV